MGARRSPRSLHGTLAAEITVSLIRGAETISMAAEAQDSIFFDMSKQQQQRPQQQPRCMQLPTSTLSTSTLGGEAGIFSTPTEPMSLGATTSPLGFDNAYGMSPHPSHAAAGSSIGEQILAF